MSESRGRGKGKGKPDPEDLHLRNHARQELYTGQCMLCRQMSDFARDCPSRGSLDENHSHLKRAFGSVVGMVRDQSTTLITKPGTPCGSECGWRELISFVFSGPDGLVSIVTVFAPAGILVVQILSTIVN